MTIRTFLIIATLILVLAQFAGYIASLVRGIRWAWEYKKDLFG